jgi:RNA polymerase sigma factor (sigma-70 family)
MKESSAVELVTRWQQGDQQAAAELFRRYASRLIGLARARLSSQMASRFDPEDVVQSAYRSFFVSVRDGDFDIQRSGELWHLLVTITLRKYQHHVRHNLAEQRAIHREHRSDQENGDAGAMEPPSREPSPIEAAALIEQVQQLMAGLEPVQCRIIEMRLQGYGLWEIADETRCSHRTVCRVLADIRRQLEQAQREQDCH